MTAPRLNPAASASVFWDTPFASRIFFNSATTENEKVCEMAIFKLAHSCGEAKIV